MSLNRKQKNRNRNLVFQRKLMGCEDCGSIDFDDLTFHHVDTRLKTQGISRLVHTGTPRRLQNELLVCRVLCSKCHAKYHTATGAIRYDKQRAAIPED